MLSLLMVLLPMTMAHDWFNCQTDQAMAPVRVNGVESLRLRKHEYDVFRAAFTTERSVSRETLASRVVTAQVGNVAVPALLGDIEFLTPDNTSFAMTISVPGIPVGAPNVTGIRGSTVEGTWLCMEKQTPVNVECSRALDEKCQDGSVCCGDRTCCLNLYGSFGCCQYEGATCCNDRVNCCPRDSICKEDGSCENRFGHVFQIASQHTPERQKPTEKKTEKKKDFPVKAPLAVCQDGSVCTGGTCCPTSDGWGCCPTLNATCCADQIHCCPHEYSECHVSSGQCGKPDGQGDARVPWLLKTKSVKPARP